MGEQGTFSEHSVAGLLPDKDAYQFCNYGNNANIQRINSLPDIRRQRNAFFV